MAAGMKFLFPIDLTKNQLLNAVIQNLASAPSNGIKAGQIYFNTEDQKFFIAKDIEGTVTWTEVGVFYDLSVVQSNGDIKLRLAGTDNIDSDIQFTGSGAVTVTRTDASTIDISVPTAQATEQSLTLTFDSGTTEGTDKYEFDGGTAVAIDFVGGTDIDIAKGAAEITFNHADVARTNTTDTDAPAFAGTFDVVDSITTSATGHVTAVNTTTITVPTETTLSKVDTETGTWLTNIAVSDHEITLSRSNSTEDTITVGELIVSSTGAGSGDVTIAGNLTVNGTTTTINTATVEIEDNLIEINSNQTSTPPSNLIGGIEVNRGDETNFQFVFVEATDDFRLGEVGDLQPVLTRDEVGNLNDGDLLVWDDANNRAVGTTLNDLSVPRKYTETITVATSVDVEHKLDTEDITFSLRAGNEFVFADVEILDADNIRIRFGEVAGITSVKLTVIG